VLTWLFVWSDVQMIGILYGLPHATATPSSLASAKLEHFILLVLAVAYPDCPGKRPINKYLFSFYSS